MRWGVELGYDLILGPLLWDAWGFIHHKVPGKGYHESKHPFFLELLGGFWSSNFEIFSSYKKKISLDRFQQVAHNIEGWLNVFTFIFVVDSQIWLNHRTDNFHWDCIEKLKTKALVELGPSPVIINLTKEKNSWPCTWTTFWYSWHTRGEVIFCHVI
jgi:hypothetical protein